MSETKSLEPDNVFLLKTRQTASFRGLVEALKDVLNEISLQISKEAIRVTTLDHSKTAIVYLKIDANQCEAYECKAPMTVGINIVTFFKFIKASTSADTIALNIREGHPERLHIRIESPEKNMVVSSELTTLDIDEDSVHHAHPIPCP